MFIKLRQTVADFKSRGDINKKAARDDFCGLKMNE